MEEPGFWDDAEKSTKLVQEAKHLKDTVELYRGLEQEYEDIQVMIEMGYEENDPSLIPEIEEMLQEFEKNLEKLRLETLLSGEYDKYNAILRLNAGAGGTESCDWCSMLYRMYCRWADKMGFKTEVLDYLDGDEAGIKSVTIQINGENAFGYLKSERGVHRLVRIPPLMRQENGRPPLCPAMLCRILRKIWMWRSIRMICGLIPIVPAEPAVSILTRPLRLSGLPIFPQELWYSARMNVPSSRTRIRQCRC